MCVYPGRVSAALDGRVHVARCVSCLTHVFVRQLEVLYRKVCHPSGSVVAVPSLVAEAGQPLTIGCDVTLAAGATLHQVRWLHKHKPLLSYEHSVPVRVSHQEADVELAAHHNTASYITIRKVGPGHEGCYSCVFDVFPTGQQRNRTCVTVVGESGLREGSARVGRPETNSPPCVRRR